MILSAPRIFEHVLRNSPGTIGKREEWIKRSGEKEEICVCIDLKSALAIPLGEGMTKVWNINQLIIKLRSVLII